MLLVVLVCIAEETSLLLIVGPYDAFGGISLFDNFCDWVPWIILREYHFSAEVNGVWLVALASFIKLSM